MRKIDALFAEYAESHQNSTNKFIHWICVPLIFWCIMGFISIIPSPHYCINFYGCISIVSIICIVLVSIFYFPLSWKIALIMIVIMLIFEHLLYAINIYFGRKSWIIFLSVFVVTWILQFLKHKIEGKKPSFLKDLQFLLVGPIWLLSFVLKKLKINY